ncbi:acetyl-CoA synthetase-like protein [Xylariaceae sp. FL1019]|nr:acetyl-CoA synthetase-like protein [Xylariaceae sp. FL1019]
MGSNTSPIPYGKRLLPVELDKIAREDGQRPWASIPIDDNDLSKGYEDINFAVLANAINRLAWVIHDALGQSTTFDAIAYLGAADIRYHMIQMAACKTGHKVLFSSHLNSLAVHLSLMDKVDCKALFYSAGTKVDDILGARPMTGVLIPDLDDLIYNREQAKWYEYTKTFEEAALDPYGVLQLLTAKHTSGTTGDPKPLVMNHALVATIDAQGALPDRTRRVMDFVFPEKPGTRIMIPTSPFHVISAVIGLSMAVFGGGVFVYPHRSYGLTSELPDLLAVFTYSKSKVIFLMPYIMEKIAAAPNPEKYIANFKTVCWGGGVLPISVQDTWRMSTRLQDTWGSSEMILPPQLRTAPEDHEYVSFDLESSGLEFREVNMEDDGSSEKLYEMVATLTPKSEPFSGYFAREGIKAQSDQPPYPEFRIGDLWTRHPDPKKAHNTFRFAGRIDDLINLATGINMHPTLLEQGIKAHPKVREAIVLGSRHMQPIALVELHEGTDKTEVWREVLEPMNKKVQSFSRIAETHFISVPFGGLVRTPKGTISRPKSERMFAREIEDVYQRFGDRWADDGRREQETGFGERGEESSRWYRRC